MYSVQEQLIASISSYISLETFFAVLFGVILIVFGVFSVLMFWHWKLYSTGKFTTVSTMVMYVSVSSALLSAMVASIIWMNLL